MFWAIGVPGLLIAVVGVGLFWKQADGAVTDASRNEAMAVAELVSSTFSLARKDSSGGPGTLAHRAVAETIRSELRIFQHVRSLRVIDHQGVIRWSHRVEEEGVKAREADRLLAQANDAVRFDRGRAEVVRTLGGMECGGCHQGAPMNVGVLQVSIDQPELRQSVASVFGRALASVLVLFGVMLLLTVLSLQLFLNRPLSRLASVMRKAEAGDFLVRADVRSRDEIGVLADAFNRMLARLTSMKATEIDTHRDLEQAQQQLALKKALEETNTELHQRVNEQALLVDVARSLTSTLELPELFGRISALVAERLAIPQFSIMLLKDGVLEVKSSVPRGMGAEGMTFREGEGACGRAARTKTAVYIPDLESETDIYDRRGQSPRGSLLSVPMIHKGTVLGVINFERPTRNAFSPQETELLSAVADLAATATKNAILHAETVELSITDPLTGAANRRHLFSRLEIEIARALRYRTALAVVMVDIDSFKHLNDTQGHRVGDIVLRKVCDLLKQATRKVDTLARYGGEEFMLILPQASKPEAFEVAEKLRRAVEEAPLEEGKSQPLGRITISVGVSSLHVDAETLEQLVDCADAALYASKRGGRNKATAYEPGMELHPGRERGPYAARRRQTGEIELPTEKAG